MSCLCFVFSFLLGKKSTFYKKSIFLTSNFLKICHICYITNATRAAPLKNPKTMKHFFLWAVAISALCSSCETADESILENNTLPNEVLQPQQRVESDYNVYKNVVNSFEYDEEQSYNNNLLKFQQHVNDMLPNGNITEVIDFTQLSLLENANETFINQLNYSNETKTAIAAILNNTFTADTLTLITNTQEFNLLNALYAMHSDANGDEGDDKWRKRKIIAFAYGSQYSLTSAVLYAGAIDLMKYQD